MSGNMWSGPSRALQFHMEMFEEVDHTARWARDHATRPVHPNALHPTFKQRALLQTSLSGLAVEGESTALIKEDYSDAFGERNISGTLQAMEHELEILDRGQTFYVSHHMSEMIRAIGETMTPEPLFETDLPAPTGVVVFEYPICFPDLDPETGVLDARIKMPCRAMGWKIVDVYLPSSLQKMRGIEFIMWVDRRSYIDIYEPSIVKLGHDVSSRGGEIDHRFWKTDHSGWSFGTSWKIGEEPVTVDGKVTTEDGTIHELTGQHRRWMLAFFRLYWQRILVPQSYRPTKYEKKRGLRMGRPLEDGYIKVVRLRREMEAERHNREGGDGNYFDHQFVVSAHPRRQWFKSLGPARNPDGSFNHDSHRLIWIEAHVKGPISGPLVVGQQVQALVR